MGDLSTLEVIIIAIVEGLTEFLPVSSTGHMIITQNLLGIESTEFVKAFTVIIQFGAILSVVWLYWKRFFRLNYTPVPADTSALKRFLHKFDFTGTAGGVRSGGCAGISVQRQGRRNAGERDRSGRDARDWRCVHAVL